MLSLREKVALTDEAKARFRWTKVWLAVGMAGNPIFAAFLVEEAIEPGPAMLIAMGVVYAIALAIGLLFGIVTWKKLNRADDKQEIVVLAVCCLFLVSALAAILLLIKPERYFPLRKDVD